MKNGPRNVLTLARRELGTLLDHPTGYILLVVFLAVNNFLFFRSAYLMGLASLRPMLELLPWVSLFFVPAVTMRSLAEDARSGTLETVLAQPVTELELVVGKYLGSLGFILIALLLTLTIPLGLSRAADLPMGVIVSQYVGAGLLVAGMAAVGVWASSVTRNQITAFIVGVTVMFLLILAGASPLLTGLPPRLAAVMASLSVLPHFESITRGVIDLRDVVYFATLAGLFLAFAYGALMARKLSPHRAARRRLRLGTVLVAVTLVVVNLFGGHIGGRLDLTPGKAFTLSPATRDILGGLDDLLTIKLFVTERLPTEISVVKRDVGDLLSDMRRAGGGNVRVVEVDPAEDEEAMSEARSLGIPPLRFNVVGESELQVQEGYFGLAVQYADGSEIIPVVQRTSDLEYRIMSYVRSLTETERAVVGMLESEADGAGNTYRQLRRGLESNYEVRTVTATDSTPIDPEIRALVLAGAAPVILDTLQLERFGDYLRRGGGVLVMASGMTVQAQGFMAAARPVGWNQVLADYGVSVRGDMVFDLASNEAVSMPSAVGRVMMQYPFWVRALSTRLTAMNLDLEALTLPWASSLDTAGARPGTVIPLFVSSNAAGVERGRSMVQPQRSFRQDSLGVKLMAVAVDPLAADSGAVAASGRIVLVGNGEFAADRYAQNAEGGLLFALNAVDWLSQDEALVRIRSKSRRPPPLVFDSDGERDAVKWINMAGVPLLLIAFAALHLWRRRRRTRQVYRPVEAA
jgi:ABC-type uncharacterized transport system involved in gliding motility auxiliary subunit/ABC-type transport system involved in multi-copper enzyme maturation permease subunit